MQIIDFKELISFIENSPEKSIPKSVLITEINNMKRDAESHVHKAGKRINIAIIATILYIITKLSFILFGYFLNSKPVLLNLYIIDVIVPSLLCIGLIYKNKHASLAILIYFLISSYLHLDVQGINIFRFIILFVYSYVYIQSYIATIAYQKHKILGN